MTRIVHCPGCKVLLVEPTAGVAIYQCGNCFKVLYAKHAIQSRIEIQDEHLRSRLNAAPPPLYRQRETPRLSPTTSSSTYSTRSNGDSRPLYTPRDGGGGGGTGGETTGSFMLIQGMQKLALDAFPGGRTEAWEDNGGGGGGANHQGNREFEQGKDVDMYSYHDDPHSTYEPSDYHSTLDEFDNRSHVNSEDSYPAASSRRTDFLCQAPGNTTSTVAGQLENDAVTPRFVRPTMTVEVPPPPLPPPLPQLGNGSEHLVNGCNATSSSSSASTSRRRYPPLEYPYVICRHCKSFLKVPRTLPLLTKPYQKLRCGACQRVSRFSLPDGQFSSSSSLEIVPAGGLASSSSSSPMNTQAAGHHSTPFNYFDESRANKLDVLTSDRHLHGSPVRASAPASLHRPAHASSKPFEGKGYESAPEFQSSYSVASKDSSSTSTHHARSESGASSSNGQSLPMAPCLHELFGYESPSQFLNKERVIGDNHRTNKTTGKGIKGLLLSKLHLSHHPATVSINGKTIPEDQVRRAKVRAGQIHPGSYWYDCHAGFWGVMGGPCLGIIPAGIEELNYPMQRNCAGGKTGVLVNGRELHQRDLDKLVRRGLPPTPHAAYTINIDGVVVDAAMETQIKCLGKLAPTIQEQGYGFGMFPLSRGV